MVCVTTLSIPSMMCGACVSSVESALRLPGVRSVDVQLAEKQVSIVYDAGTTESAILAELSKSGKQAAVLSRSEMSELRAWCMDNWRVLVVAAALVPPAVALVLTSKPRGGTPRPIPANAKPTSGAGTPRSLREAANDAAAFISSHISELTSRTAELWRSVYTPILEKLQLAAPAAGDK